ncbi:MAG: dynamin family protein [Lachnospiraceae bacterium]|nr:dynamin family protein [Lachnospiraceae bacterium]SDJ04232.1 Dynamin family protein [Lachnospiraceae bacterium G41]
MKELMIMYHPVKKEIRFLAKAKGEFVEIPYAMCPWLNQYGPDNGEFLLQNHGNKFFDDIWEQFLRDNVNLVFKGTKVDYEDFVKKVREYNKSVNEDRFKVTQFIELPSVTEIYTAIADFCDATLETFDNELQNSDIRKSFVERKTEFESKKARLNNSDVNLCLVGTYSSGKSTFINALIGKRILPESINSETAKMFRIKNAKEPAVSFVIKKGSDPDTSVIANIVWDAEKKRFAFHADGECEITQEKINSEVNSAIMFRLQQHEQLYQVLKKLNDIPNMGTDENEEYIDGIIEVSFPIPLDENINFTFYDTPGTDSNSNEHLLVLQKALAQQTNSILIVLYEPTKMEGTGNSILYNLINSSNRENEATTIDLTRSLHVINQADTKSLTDLQLLKKKKVEVTLKETDKIYNEEAQQIDLSKERLFFVSSKAAYIAKAIGNNVDTEDERRWLANHKNEINNDPVDDPFRVDNIQVDVDTGMYFKLDKLARSDNETKALIKDCFEELKKCNNPEDSSLYPILQRIYVNSGMYAIEKEIIQYGRKYALAVKAKGLYDGIKSVVDFIREDYEVIENQARLSKEEIERNINTMKTSMVKDIDEAYADYLTNMTTENMVFQIDDINQLYTVMGNRQIQAGKIADKMKWIALRPEVFEEKNNIIRNELNRYLQEIDDNYKNNRGRILIQQIDELKGIIIKKISGYKGIDEEIIKRITNVADTQVPPSSLKALKMDEYINKQKAIFIFSTNDKKSYKNDVETMFANTTKVQFDSYIEEITKVAIDKTAELVQEFKNNIDIISANLELLIKDEEKASAEQAKAKAVLDLVEKKDKELNMRIWGEDKEDKPIDVNDTDEADEDEE